MVLIQETYTNIGEINESLYNYVLKTELSDYATTKYVKDTYQSYTHLNKYYINNTHNYLNQQMLGYLSSMYNHLTYLS